MFVNRAIVFKMLIWFNMKRAFAETVFFCFFLWNRKTQSHVQHIIVFLGIIFYLDL